jgi:hypothetical protein
MPRFAEGKAMHTRRKYCAGFSKSGLRTWFGHCYAALPLASGDHTAVGTHNAGVLQNKTRA